MVVSGQWGRKWRWHKKERRLLWTKRAMDNTQQQPHVVQEESSHEFYANLIGIKQPALSKRRAIPKRTNRRPSIHSQQRESLPVVASDETTIPPDNIRSNPYHRALKDPPKLSSLSLDKTNKGYAMLSKMGWNEHEGGLGKRRQGNLTPIKTFLKNDKRGLGRVTKREKRVTHYPHTQQEEKQEKKETKAQRKRRRKAERERDDRRQKKARMLLRTDVSDEYEQLYMSLHDGG